MDGAGKVTGGEGEIVFPIHRTNGTFGVTDGLAFLKLPHTDHWSPPSGQKVKRK